MSDRLARLERQLEGLIESSLARLLGARLSVSEVAARLARAMEDGTRTDRDGRAHAPDHYALTLHPRDVSELLAAAPDLHADLGRGLLEAARATGYQVRAQPRITLAADPSSPAGQVRVVAWHGTNPLEFTKAMPREAAEPEAPPALNAFLIIDGKRHFPLDRPVVNIGRRLDNQIILEDAHVSRTHAQLRLRAGRYVLFDLGSSSGTRVNGRAIKQHVLLAGDVITIGAARLVYGEDAGGAPDATPAYRAPFPPRPAGDQRTIVGRWDEEPET